MFSRVATRTCVAGCRLTHTSTNSSQAAAATTTPAVAADERNEVDYPRPIRRIDPAPVRMGFIPETWFELLYPKTGVTGPYMLGVGLTTYLVSKEIYVLEHEFYGGIVLAAMAIAGIKKFGPSVAALLDDEISKEKEQMASSRLNGIKSLEESISDEQLAIEQAQSQPVLFHAKKENIGLQLEAAYRQRLQRVHQEVKKRLDYQLETSNVLSRFEQRHMVDWIVQNVRKSITPTQEAATLKQCLVDLKALAVKA